MIIAVAITILELYSTAVLAQRGFTEGNPIMRPVLTRLGLPAFLLFNAVLSVVLLSFLAWGSLELLKDDRETKAKDRTSETLEMMKYIPIGTYCLIKGFAVVHNLLLMMS